MSAWNDPRPDSFCEGFLWKQIVPGFDEFFSGLSGIVILFIGFLGLAQPRLEVLLRMIYASIVVSGVGTMMMHWKRINGFNLADTLPLLVTLTMGMIAFFDEIIFEFRRPRGATGGMLPVRDPAQEIKDDRMRKFASSIFYIISFSYLIAGIILLIYSDLFYIFGVYFGVPFGLLSIGGMILINHRYRKEKLPQYQTMVWLTVIGITNGLISIVYKIIDTSYCNQVTIWLFPHPLFHITLTYATHCIIVFLAFHRANNYLIVGDGIARVTWWLWFFPVVVVPFRSQLITPVGFAPGGAEALDKEFDEAEEDDSEEVQLTPPAENPAMIGRRASVNMNMRPLRASPSFHGGIQGFSPYNPYAVHPYTNGEPNFH